MSRRSFGIVKTFQKIVAAYTVAIAPALLATPFRSQQLVPTPLVHRTYTATNFDAGRLNVMLNNSSEIAFNHSLSSSSGYYATSAIIQMNAGDYLVHKPNDCAIGAYTARNHTDLFLAFLLATS